MLTLSAIILLCLLLSLHKERGGAMGKERLLPVRGLLCFLIVVHHIYREMPESFSHVFFIYNNVGFWVVSMFFFFSGYGLLLSLRNKAGYLAHGFVKKKFLNILLPSLFVGLCYVAVYCLTGQFSLNRLFVLLKHGQCIPTSHWFIYVLFCQYVFFYLCFKSVKRFPMSLYTASTIGFVATFYLLGYPSIWYKSTLFIVAGMLYCQYSVRSADWKLSATMLGAFVLLSILVGICKSDITIYKVLGNVAISASVLCLFLAFSCRFTVDNRLLRFLGEYSMYIYLLHQPVLDVCRFLNGKDAMGSELVTIVIFAVSCLLAVISSNTMKKVVPKVV